MIRTLLLLLTLPFTAHAQSGPPHDIEGVWQTGARDGSWGYVRFAPCGDAICGTLIGGGGVNVDPQYFGTVMVNDMRWDGTEFTDGTLLDVENGRTYLSNMRFRSADRLRVSGCVLGGIICGGQTWARVE
jgi:uncharacterized protein (DUF2147 family)